MVEQRYQAVLAVIADGRHNRIRFRRTHPDSGMTALLRCSDETVYQSARVLDSPHAESTNVRLGKFSRMETAELAAHRARLMYVRGGVVTIPLVILAVGFAYSVGAHYTGACMGMPHALNAISARAALLMMAPLTLMGATFASHKVEHTVGHNLLTGPGLSVAGLVVVIGVAFALTSVFNLARIPTSTIQILVFTVVGTGLGASVGIHWATIGALAIVWVAAPPVAAGLGFGLTRLLDRAPAIRAQTQPARERLAAAGTIGGRCAGASATTSPAPGVDAATPSTTGGALAAALVAVGALASFAMGGNDVANATGSLVANHTFTPLTAGLIGGLGLAAGVLTWGRPLLRKVAFDIVTVDRAMATAAQLVQAVVVLAAVGFGFFTSMNQALIGAMSGTAAARGRHTVHRSALLGVLRGWIIGPGVGIALGYAITRLLIAAIGVQHLLGRPA